MLTPAVSYDSLLDGFSWAIPEHLNMAVQVCDAWAEEAPDRTAIIDMRVGRIDVSYADLRAMADQLAHHLRVRGVARGDRVGVLRSQDPWCAAAHIAVWKLGAISTPLFKLFKRDALQARIDDAGMQFVITDEDGHALLADCAGVEECVPESTRLPAQEREAFETVATRAEDPAVLIYTSGTTGPAKGALHAHRVLTGHLPGVEMSHDFLGQPGDCLWTPADWAWIGGLFDVLMPGLALGVPVVAARMPKFDPLACVSLMREAAVKNVFFPPTALRMLKAADLSVPGLRSVASGGEPLGKEMLDWGRTAFGVSINEFYGQTECNMVVSSAGSLFDPSPGCIGRAVPGHAVAVIDEAGEPTSGEGDIAVKRGSQSMMLEYWNRPEATAAKFVGDWMRTGDRGVWDGDYLRFLGREDDVITSSGYRIGPAEIEDCLLKHPCVATVGVVGKPCAMRTEIVKAYVVLKPGFEGSVERAEDLQNFVKDRLASYSYPREISFSDTLPMTVTGKIIRGQLKARAIAEVGA